jgi:cytochrome P450
MRTGTKRNGTKIATDIVVQAKLVDLEDDPYPLYCDMRRECPIAWVPETGRLWVTTWDLCAEAGNNYEVFGPTREAFTVVYGQPNIMSLTGEAHLQARKPLDARFRPRAVNEYVDKVIRSTAIRYINRIRNQGHADLNADILEPVSVRAVGDVLGFNDLDDAVLSNWFRSLGAYLVNYGRNDSIAAKGEATKLEIRAYLERRLPAVRAEHDGSTLAHMLRDGLESGNVRNIDEIIGTVGVMIVGGFQEPAHGAANTMLGLLSNSPQADVVSINPDAYSDDAVKEGLRWIAPFGMTEKLTTKDVVLGGLTIPAGTEVALIIASANRDEARFDKGDCYDLHREQKSHASFGYGAHFCVGNYIARKLAQVCVEELFRGLPKLKLDPTKEPFVHGWAVRAAKSLPVVWNP